MKKKVKAKHQLPETPKKEIRPNFIAEWAVNLLILLFTFAMVAQAYVIPTGSMEDNLLIGDHIIVDKLAYAPEGPISKHLLPYTPVSRGDIICIRSPIDLNENLVKRVIGVPGDRIRIVNKQVYINGKPVDEPYKRHKTDYFDSYRDNFPSSPNTFIYDGGRDMLANHVSGGEVVVPQSNYFAMGDNRDVSLDSRYWGFVPRDNIIGKPVLVWWSYDAPTERLMNGNIDPVHLLDIAFNFFEKTRWDRTFQLIRGYPLN